MSILIIIAKVFATITLLGGVLGGVFYIWAARHNPVYGKTVERIAGALVLGLCIYAMYYVWS